MKSVFAVLGVAALLLGGGCTRPVVVNSAVDAREQEMAERLRLHPLAVWSEEEKLAEQRLTWGVMGEGTPERIALFEGRGARKATGRASFVKAPDGRWTLVLDDTFAVEPGPDLVVALGEVADPDVESARLVELGPLKLTKGAQAYPIPATVDVTKMRSVVVYAKGFQIVFGVAAVK